MLRCRSASIVFHPHVVVIGDSRSVSTSRLSLFILHTLSHRLAGDRSRELERQSSLSDEARCLVIKICPLTLTLSRTILWPRAGAQMVWNETHLWLAKWCSIHQKSVLFLSRYRTLNTDYVRHSLSSKLQCMHDFRALVPWIAVHNHLYLDAFRYFPTADRRGPA